MQRSASGFWCWVWLKYMVGISYCIHYFVDHYITLSYKFIVFLFMRGLKQHQHFGKSLTVWRKLLLLMHVVSASWDSVYLWPSAGRFVFCPCVLSFFFGLPWGCCPAPKSCLCSVSRQFLLLPVSHRGFITQTTFTLLCLSISVRYSRFIHMFWSVAWWVFCWTICKTDCTCFLFFPHTCELLCFLGAVPCSLYKEILRLGPVSFWTHMWTRWKLI